MKWRTRRAFRLTDRYPPTLFFPVVTQPSILLCGCGCGGDYRLIGQHVSARMYAIAAHSGHTKLVEVQVTALCIQLSAGEEIRAHSEPSRQHQHVTALHAAG
jgi:hypothetical protein